MTVYLPDWPGICADGVTDDKAAIEAAWACDPILDGGGKTYAISGNLTAPQKAVLRDFNIIQLDPNVTGRKTIVHSHGTGLLRLENGTIEQIGSLTSGTVADNSAVRMNGGQLIVRNVTFKFGGRGSVIQIVNGQNVVIEQNIFEEIDYRFAGGNEDVFAIWLNGTTGGTIQRNQIKGAYNNPVSGSRDYRVGAGANGSDGITMGGCLFVTVANNYIDHVGEGIDLTGSAGNYDNLIFGNVVREVGAFGIKLANTAMRNMVDRNTIVKAGYAGIVLNAPNVAVSTNVELNDIRGNVIGSTGWQTVWSGYTRAAILVLNSGYYPNYPTNNRFIDNVIDNNGTADWAIYSQSSGNKHRGNIISNAPSGISSNVSGV